MDHREQVFLKNCRRQNDALTKLVNRRSIKATTSSKSETEAKLTAANSSETMKTPTKNPTETSDASSHVISEPMENSSRAKESDAISEPKGNSSRTKESDATSKTVSEPAGNKKLRSRYR